MKVFKVVGKGVRWEWGCECEVKEVYLNLQLPPQHQHHTPTSILAGLEQRHKYSSQKKLPSILYPHYTQSCVDQNQYL